MLSLASGGTAAEDASARQQQPPGRRARCQALLLQAAAGALAVRACRTTVDACLCSSSIFALLPLLRTTGQSRQHLPGLLHGRGLANTAIYPGTATVGLRDDGVVQAIPLLLPPGRLGPVLGLDARFAQRVPRLGPTGRSSSAGAAGSTTAAPSSSSPCSRRSGCPRRRGRKCQRGVEAGAQEDGDDQERSGGGRDVSAFIRIVDRVCWKIRAVACIVAGVTAALPAMAFHCATMCTPCSMAVWLHRPSHHGCRLLEAKWTAHAMRDRDAKVAHRRPDGQTAS